MAIIRARVVLPVPDGPVMRIAWFGSLLFNAAFYRRHNVFVTNNLPKITGSPSCLNGHCYLLAVVTNAIYTGTPDIASVFVKSSYVYWSKLISFLASQGELRGASSASIVIGTSAKG